MTMLLCCLTTESKNRGRYTPGTTAAVAQAVIESSFEDIYFTICCSKMNACTSKYIPRGREDRGLCRMRVIDDRAALWLDNAYN